MNARAWFCAALVALPLASSAYADRPPADPPHVEVAAAIESEIKEERVDTLLARLAAVRESGVADAAAPLDVIEPASIADAWERMNEAIQTAWAEMDKEIAEAKAAMRRELDAAGRAIERELTEARAEADRRAREAEEQAARELAAMHARLQDERSAMRMTIERLETENANLRRRESEARRRLNEYAAAPSTVEEPAADEAEAIRAEPAIEEDVIAPAEAPIAATPEGAAPDAEARPMGRAAGPRDAAPARVGPSGLTEEEIVAEIARLQGVIEALKRGEAAAGSMPSAKPQARRIPPDRR